MMAMNRRPSIWGIKDRPDVVIREKWPRSFISPKSGFLRKHGGLDPSLARRSCKNIGFDAHSRRIFQQGSMLGNRIYYSNAWRFTLDGIPACRSEERRVGKEC